MKNIPVVNCFLLMVEPFSRNKYSLEWIKEQYRELSVKGIELEYVKYIKVNPEQKLPNFVYPGCLAYEEE